MSAIDQLRAAVDAGFRPTIAGLSEAQIDELHASLVPHGSLFSAAQLALIESYALEVDAVAEDAIQGFNAGSPHRVAFLDQASGGIAISCRCLTWCGTGEPLNPIKALLWSLPIIPNHIEPSTITV